MSCQEPRRPALPVRVAFGQNGRFMKPLDVHRSPVFRLLLLVNLTARPFASLFERRHQLSLVEWRTMLTLAAEPDLPAAAVADRLGLDKMAVSRAVAGLERRGRVRRLPDPADGRRALLALTDAGWALYRLIAPFGRDRENALLAELDEAERVQLDRILGKLIRAARALPDGAEADVRVPSRP